VYATAKKIAERESLVRPALIRDDDLYKSMSSYLARRVEQTPGFVAMDWRPGTAIDESAGIAAA